MNRRSFLRLSGGACAPFLIPQLRPAAATRPNVIVILADDIGYGDLGCYGATAVKTPNLDKLAANGVRFTDAHSASATCTPSRYAMMTGEYAWRKPGTAILPGDANLIIDTKRANLPALMKQGGYATAAVGKWHLGLGDTKPIDWNKEIKPSPREVGFDYHFIIPATGDRVPCVYVENGFVVNLDPKDPIQVNYQDKIGNEPTGREHPELLRMKLSNGHDYTIVNGISRIGYMSGGKAARWNDEKIAETLAGKASAFIEKNKAKPFFLYLATHDIHVPRVPDVQFQGTTGCGRRCEAIAELDWTVGKVMDTLKRNNLADNTMVVFCSDNGPVVDDGYADGSVENLKTHKPGGKLRGTKYSIYEGGTREPMIAHWPARIKPGVSDALVCQVDFLHSFATLAGVKVPENAGPDSFNVLPALLGESKKGRDVLVEHARNIGLRQGNWKLVPAMGNPEAQAKKKQNDRNNAATRNGSGKVELYDLSTDIGEEKNLADAHPDRVREMTALLEKIRTAGRSRP